jgi:hypothetical protein
MVLGLLIPILHLDGVAVASRLLGKRQVALIVPLRMPNE